MWEYYIFTYFWHLNCSLKNILEIPLSLSTFSDILFKQIFCKEKQNPK